MNGHSDNHGGNAVALLPEADRLLLVRVFNLRRKESDLGDEDVVGPTFLTAEEEREQAMDMLALAKKRLELQQKNIDAEKERVTEELRLLEESASEVEEQLEALEEALEHVASGNGYSQAPRRQVAAVSTSFSHPVSKRDKGRTLLAYIAKDLKGRLHQQIIDWATRDDETMNLEGRTSSQMKALIGTMLSACAKKGTLRKTPTGEYGNANWTITIEGQAFLDKRASVKEETIADRKPSTASVNGSVKLPKPGSKGRILLSVIPGHGETISGSKLVDRMLGNKLFNPDGEKRFKVSQWVSVTLSGVSGLKMKGLIQATGPRGNMEYSLTSVAEKALAGDSDSESDLGLRPHSPPGPSFPSFRGQKKEREKIPSIDLTVFPKKDAVKKKPDRDVDWDSILNMCLECLGPRFRLSVVLKQIDGIAHCAGFGYPGAMSESEAQRHLTNAILRAETLGTVKIDKEDKDVIIVLDPDDDGDEIAPLDPDLDLDLEEGLGTGAPSDLDDDFHIDSSKPGGRPSAKPRAKKVDDLPPSRNFDDEDDDESPRRGRKKQDIKTDEDWEAAVTEAFAYNRDQGENHLDLDDVTSFIGEKHSSWDAFSYPVFEAEEEVKKAIDRLVDRMVLVTDDDETWYLDNN